MKFNDLVTESFQNVSIGGVLYSLNTDEKKIYTQAKESGKLMKNDLSEYDQRIANGLVTRGLLKRRKNPQHEIYFVTKGRRKVALNKPIEEVAPPDNQIEKWIEDNKDRFQEKYGKEYKKYLYGKAWNKFNGKKLNETWYYDVDVDDIYYDLPSSTSFRLEFQEEATDNEIGDEVRDKLSDWADAPLEDWSWNVNNSWNDEDNSEEEDEGDPLDDTEKEDFWDGEETLPQEVNNEIHETLKLAGVQLNESDSSQWLADNLFDTLKDNEYFKESYVKEFSGEEGFEDALKHMCEDWSEHYEDFTMDRKYQDVSWVQILGIILNVDEIWEDWENWLKEDSNAEKFGAVNTADEWDGEEDEDEEQLDEEITPSRLWKYQESDDMNFAILSADRSERSEEENKEKNKELKKDIKDMGYWYTELKGGYVEVSEDGQRVPVDGENSLIVPNMTRDEAIELGKKYDQDSVMFKDAKNKTLQYIVTNERAGKIGDVDSNFETEAGKDNFSVSRGSDLDYYSRLHKSNKPDLKIGFNWKG